MVKMLKTERRQRDRQEERKERRAYDRHRAEMASIDWAALYAAGIPSAKGCVQVYDEFIERLDHNWFRLRDV